jgi:hypothetical protein
MVRHLVVVLALVEEEIKEKARMGMTMISAGIRT